MTKFFKKIIVAGFAIALLAGSSLSSVFAESVTVSLPTFKITMNDIRIDNNERLYPVILFRDITYVPMTYNDSRFLGLETKWDAATGLEVNKISTQIPYNPNKGYASSYLESASLPQFGIRVNGQSINNNAETYPLLVFRDITYFPLTWRYMVDSFGWTSSFDAVNGLIISSKAGSTSVVTPPPATPKVFSQDFGAVTVIFDRNTIKQPGNLSVRENNSTKRIGNPNFIYGVGYLQAGSYGDYTAVDKVEYANRWVYTLAVDPAAYPVTSRNVRINIDTNEVQAVDGSATGNSNGQVFSRQFDNITVMIDRFSNKQPGNLAITENNITKKIGNPNFIYGVGYLQAGSYGEYTAVDKLEYANRWVYTLAVDPSASPIISKNVRVNIDTNEVQSVDGSTTTDTGALTGQFYSQQFGALTVMIDRNSNTPPGNLYVKENNSTKKIGNPSYIYGVSYINLFGLENFSPVNNVSVSGRWVYTLAIDPSASPKSSRSARVNIDTNEVQWQ